MFSYGINPKFHGSAQEDFPPAFGQLRQIILDEQNSIPLEWPRLACETGRAIGNKQLRFTARTREQKDFTRVREGCGTFRPEYRAVRPVCTQWQPYGLSAPPGVHNLATQRQHLRQATAGKRRQIPLEAGSKQSSSDRYLERRHLSTSSSLGHLLLLGASVVLDGFKVRA
jgi:hypothetical protein